MPLSPLPTPRELTPVLHLSRKPPSPPLSEAFSACCKGFWGCQGTVTACRAPLVWTQDGRWLCLLFHETEEESPRPVSVFCAGASLPREVTSVFSVPVSSSNWKVCVLGQVRNARVICISHLLSQIEVHLRKMLYLITLWMNSKLCNSETAVC